MKKILSLFIFLASCSPSPTQPVVVPIEPTLTTQPSPEPASTLIPPTATIASTIIPTDTPIPCDPLIADFCITDGHFILQGPIQPPANDTVERTYPYASTAGGTRDPHHGVEFVNEFGTPVYAAGEGVVIFAVPDDVAIYSPWKIYYGNLVVIEHENNLFTLYAHLSQIEVEAGDTVTAGEKIGEVGRSGVAIGSHLHFEVRRGDVEDYFSTVNPELWLMPHQSFGALSLSILDANSNFQRAKVTMQHYSTSSEVLEIYYLDTYHPSLASGEENAALGDLPAGRYRLTLIHNGQVYERWVEVQSGKLTQVVIVVK